MPRVKPKKSVSFTHSSPSPTTKPTSQYYAKFNFKLIPIHLLLLSYSLLQQELKPETIVSTITAYLFPSVLLQLIYGIPFNTNIYKKPHDKPLTFHFKTDYNVILLTISSLIITIPLFYILIVVFGAPFTSYQWENLVLSIHLSSLSIPVLINFFKIGKIDQVQYVYILSVLIGGWLGAVVIPLDWDTPWQTWPVPIVISSNIGAFIGYSLGGFVH